MIVGNDHPRGLAMLTIVPMLRERRDLPDIPRGPAHFRRHLTAAGMDVAEAADRIRGMHGPYRIPALLKRADRPRRVRGVGA